MPIRVRASLIHLLLSILVVSSILAFIYFVSFPAPYFQAIGVGEVLIIIAVVDIIIGPAITLIIYNPAKKHLKFDLAVVALLQLSAMAYGFHTAYSTRPVFAVFFEDRFMLVSASEIPEQELVDANNAKLSMTGPKFVGVRWPDESAEAKKLIHHTLKEHIGLYQMPRLYIALDQMRDEMAKHTLSAETLIKGQPDEAIPAADALVNAMLAKNNTALDEAVFLPLQSKEDMSVLLRQSDMQILGVVPVNPWAQ